METQKAGVRHGDVMLLPIDIKQLPPEAVEKFNKADHSANGKTIIVHHNDVGHDHVLHAQAAAMLALDGKEYFDIGAGAYLNHPEHGRLDVSPGIYEKRMEVEYDPFEQAMRQVID